MAISGLGNGAASAGLLRRAAILSTLVAAAVGTAGHDGASAPAGTCASPVREAVLLQLRQERAAAESSVPEIRSEDSVWLRVPRSGHRITFVSDGTVHAKWSHAGSWQEVHIVRQAGAGAVQSGDAVLLRGHWGKPLTVEGTAVHSKWGHEGSWQRLVIETKEGGAILDGSTVYLKAHTGKRIDADAPGSAGIVQARYSDMGSWQALVIELKAPPTTPAPTSAPTPAPTEPEVTTTGSTASSTPPAPTTAPPTEPPTTEPPTTTTAAPTPAPPTEPPTTKPPTTKPPPTEPPTTTAAQCVPKGSLGKCEPCLKSEQCGDGRYCCPFMKKCVASSQEACYLPIARCQPMCWDSLDNAGCSCANADFPSNWQHPTCDGSAPAPTSAPTPAPTTTADPIMGGDASTEVSAVAWEHFVLINALRKSGFTCPGGQYFAPNDVALKFDCKLWTAARLHSEDMAENNYFSHDSLDGRSPWVRAEEQGTTANAENIAAGGGTAQGTLDQFKKSDGHCRNMMNPASTAVGVGYAQGGYYGHYWTQMFRNTGDVASSCYPGMFLLQARGDDAHAHEGQHVLGEGRVLDEQREEAGVELLEPWAK